MSTRNHPDHPRYCSPERFDQLKRLRSSKGQMLVCKELVVGTIGRLTGVHIFHNEQQVSCNRRGTVYQRGRSGGLERISIV